MQFRFLDNLFFRSTVKLLVEILSAKALQFDVGSFPQCGPLAERWDVVVSKKEKKGLHPQFSALKWNLGPLDGLVVSEKKVLTRNSVTSIGNRGPLTAMWPLKKITKRSSIIIRGLQMESGAFRQLRGSFTPLLWDLYDGPLKCSFMDSYTPMSPGQIAPCNPQPPSFKPWMMGVL